MKLTYADFRELEWTSGGPGTGRPIAKKKIRSLSTSHVVNILNWVKDRPAQYGPEMHGLFETEVNMRKLVSFARGHRIPTKQPDGYWGYAPK